MSAEANAMMSEKCIGVDHYNQSRNKKRQLGKFKVGPLQRFCTQIGQEKRVLKLCFLESPTWD